MKVFIVDDSKIIRQRLASLLSDVPSVEIVGEAGGSEEAMAMIRTHNPDVVTLDIRMPDGSGLDIIGPIKSALGKVIIIMLTNYPYPQYRQECLDKGADYFLDKATEFQEIPKILERWRPVAADGGS